MKKLLSLFIVVLLSGSFANAENTKENILEEENNSPSQCASWARGVVMNMAEERDEDPNGEGFDEYISYYKALYRGCLH
ncbi:hypothetical protein [uncultured Formosa sp.]|uniref:hypothetical protein n=1 Tax=uncultured Formosa sp. TaxID=255435 RepID=UPI00262CC4B8|nr:hypothetical protein [uncultured Formosa sp.]